MACAKANAFAGHIKIRPGAGNFEGRLGKISSVRIRETMGMSEHHTGPVETGAPMDYAEHEKTYKGFLNVAKYGAAVCVALVVGMAAGFYTAGGLLGGILTFLILVVASAVLL